MDARLSARRQLSRRSLLTFIWVGAFIVLGLVGFRAHGTEPISVPVVVGTAAHTTVSAGPGVSLAGGDDHASHGNAQNPHIDILAVCMLSMLATLMLIVFFAKRHILLQPLGRIRLWAVPLPRAPARPKRLLLLHSISRI